MNYTDFNFNGKRILITGGAGFIGANLALYFQKNYPNAEIVVLDRFRGEPDPEGKLISLGHFKNLIDFEGEVIAGDINDSRCLDRIQQQPFDFIFHQAAISDTTAKDQTLTVQTNLNAFKDLLDIAVKSGAVMVYASSAATYGNAPSPQTVGTEDPQNVYGFSKLMMDHLVRKYLKKQTNRTIVGLRYFNAYGPREYFKIKTASMVLQFGLQILAGNTPKLFEGSDKIRRDFIYIEDIIQANIKAATAGKSGIYNVGTGIPRSFQEIADILQEQLNTNYGSQYIPNPYIKQYQFLTQADIKQTEQDLGYKPNYTLEDGIKAYLPEIKNIFNQNSK